MELSKVQLGQTPFIAPVAVFSATAIVQGAVMCTGATTTAQGCVIANTGGSVSLDTTDCVSFVGITQVGSSFATQSKENIAPNSHAFNIPSSGFPSTGTSSTAGLCHLPLCLNPQAIYFGQYSVTTGSGTASDNVATWTAGTTTAAASRGMSRLCERSSQPRSCIHLRSACVAIGGANAQNKTILSASAGSRVSLKYSVAPRT